MVTRSEESSDGSAASGGDKLAADLSVGNGGGEGSDDGGSG